MANTAGLSTFTAALLAPMQLRFPTSGLKVALYLSTASISPATAAYTATGEISGGSYPAGGIAVVSTQAPQLSGAVAYWTPAANFEFTNITATGVDCAFIYDTGDSNGGRGVYTFGAQTIVAGNLTLTMPADGPTTALARWTWS